MLGEGNIQEELERDKAYTFEQYMIDSQSIDRAQDPNRKRSDGQPMLLLDKQLEGSMGAAGEAGEVEELFKKLAYQGHPLKMSDVLEEMGDTLWYLSYLASVLGVSLGYIARNSVRKVWGRYPEGFSTERSLNRKNDSIYLPFPVGTNVFLVREVREKLPNSNLWYKVSPTRYRYIEVRIDEYCFDGHDLYAGIMEPEPIEPHKQGTPLFKYFHVEQMFATTNEAHKEVMRQIENQHRREQLNENG